MTGAAASASFCSVGATYAGTTIRWTGNGNGRTWSDAGNWSTGTVPDVGQTKATYQTQYVCIGDGKGGKPASVTIGGTDAFHVAGVDVGRGAHLTIQPGGELFLGSAKGTTVEPSSVDAHSQLQLDGSTLGGNSPLRVAGTLRWTSTLIDHHQRVATQTSSECVFDPSITACPGDTTPGGGRTVIASGGTMRVDGVKFGGVHLTDGRAINSSGAVVFTDFGYLEMDNGTSLTDEAHSSLTFGGVGGIYRGAGHGSAPQLRQLGGRITRKGTGHAPAIVAVPVSYGSAKPAITVNGGSLVLNASSAPTAAVHRAALYGLGTCVVHRSLVCRQPMTTAALPQGVVIGASSEKAAPAASKFAVSLAHAPSKVHGHAVLGKQIDVSAPKRKTSHSTHLTFSYDASTKGLTAHTRPVVYRNSKAVTLCKVHGLTAENTSCVLSASVSRSGSGTKGDLTIVLITIQPDGRWVVAR